MNFQIGREVVKALGPGRARPRNPYTGDVIRDNAPLYTGTKGEKGYAPISPWTNKPGDAPTSYENWKQVRKERGYKEQRKYSQERWKDLGYKLEARPYDFDPNAFRDPYSEANRAKLGGYEQFYFNRQAPTAEKFSFDLANAQASRGMSTDILNQLRGQYQGVIAGNEPSQAQIAYGQATDRNLNQILAATRGARGPAGANLRGAMYTQGDVQQQAAGQMALQRMQEIEAARQGMAGVSAQAQGMYGQDVATQQAITNAAVQQEQFGVNAAMQQEQLNNQMVQYFVAQGLTVDQAQWQATMELERQRAAQHQGAQSIAKGIGAPGGPSTGEKVGNFLLAGAGAVGSFVSDKKLKENVKESSKDIMSMLDKIKSYKYKYKPEAKMEDKEYFGVMAQDLEKSKAGKSIVRDTGEGKTVNAITGFGLVLSAAKELHERLKRLEKAYA